jgi:hypothetical protein
MTETIVVAVLALFGTLGGSWMGVRQANKLVEFRLLQLEGKVDKHNHLVERMVAVEGSVKSAHHRLDELSDKI